MREAWYHGTELDAGKLQGEIKRDEAYFGGRWKGQRDRATVGQSVAFRLLEREGRVDTKGVESSSAEACWSLLKPTPSPPRKGSVYFTDAFRG